MDSIVAIIVTYNPDLYDLRKNLSRYINACNKIIIVDNSETNLPENTFSDNRILLINMEKNIGIAGAQNIGISYVREHLLGDYLIFFDQDSSLDQFQVRQLFRDFQKLKDVGILAPGNSKDKGCFSQREEVISSGSMININSFEEVGTFKEELFIDFVDYEFCWRLRQHGRHVYVDNKVNLLHQTGKINRRVGKIVSSPFRNYYVYRNLISIMKTENYGLRFNLKWFYRMFKRVIFELVFCPNRKKRFGFICAGVKDGIKGKLGKLL
ncbi:glycosyltransferase [Levilactobacillus brevis]|uniref:glycosyltransferase n=1 Tax=Levilactobacillus brevis TaxID=1580 RepID=UPI0021A3E863|nr:glycosyltransferase [Levilactobacillus brevis]